MTTRKAAAAKPKNTEGEIVTGKPADAPNTSPPLADQAAGGSSDEGGLAPIASGSAVGNGEQATGVTGDGGQAQSSAPIIEMVPILRVVGPEKGRRRVGRRFGPEPTDIPLGDLSPAEISELEADRTLIVSVRDRPASEDDLT